MRVSAITVVLHNILSIKKQLMPSLMAENAENISSTLSVVS